MRIVLYYFICRDKKKMPFGVVIYISLLAYLVERAIFVLCQLQLSYLFLAVGFIPPPSGLQNLTPGTKRCSMIYASLLLFLPFYIFLFLLCSWLWVLYAPSGL